MKLPNKNSTWRHRKSHKLYTVLDIANLDAYESNKDRYPVTVVYESIHRSIWTKSLDEWYKSMEEVRYEN